MRQSTDHCWPSRSASDAQFLDRFGKLKIAVAAKRRDEAADFALLLDRAAA